MVTLNSKSFFSRIFKKPASTLLLHRAAERLQSPKKLNRWREQQNPLRGMNLARASALLDAYPKGEMADLQWAYHFVENADPDLFALIERRTASVLDLDWQIKTIGNLDKSKSSVAQKTNAPETVSKLAQEQAAALCEAYNRIENLYEAIEHLSMAVFRGYAHAEKHRDGNGLIRRLEILDPWNVVRDGLRGAWKYNPDAKPLSYGALPDSMKLDPENWVIREVKRHVNRIGLIKYVRSQLGEKDWDSYVEIYGIPGAVIIGPPNVLPEEEEAFTAQAQEVAEGGSGYLPNGSTVEFFEGPRGQSPFRDYLRYLTEQLVLAGTGGILNMLAASGTGTLAGNVHAQAFEQIARGEARKLSELMQSQFDGPILDAEFPGLPHHAYFELSAQQSSTHTLEQQETKDDNER